MDSPSKQQQLRNSQDFIPKSITVTRRVPQRIHSIPAKSRSHTDSPFHAAHGKVIKIKIIETFLLQKKINCKKLQAEFSFKHDFN